MQATVAPAAAMVASTVAPASAATSIVLQQHRRVSISRATSGGGVGTGNGGAVGRSRSGSTSNNGGSRRSSSSNNSGSRRNSIQQQQLSSIASSNGCWGAAGLAVSLGATLPKFHIPEEIFMDLMYVQAALRTHLRVHQRLVSTMILHNQAGVDLDVEPRDRRLTFLEDEILFIGDDQRDVLDRMRLTVEQFIDAMAERSIIVNRADLNFQIGSEIAAHLHTYAHVQASPRVRLRATEFELVHGLHLQNQIDMLTDQQHLDETDPTTLPATGQQQPPSSTAPAASMPAVTITALHRAAHPQMATERIEILLNPQDIAPATSSSSGSGKPQVSLLKPRSERIPGTGVSPPQAASATAATTTESMLASMLPDLTVTPVTFAITNTPSPAARKPIKTEAVSTPAASPTAVPQQTPSPALNGPRMNLLKALNRAKVAKAAAAAEETARAAAVAATAAAAPAVITVAAAPKPAAPKKRGAPPKSPIATSPVLVASPVSNSDDNSNLSSASQSSSSSNRDDDRDYNPLVKTPKTKAAASRKRRKAVQPAEPKPTAAAAAAANAPAAGPRKRTRACKSPSPTSSHSGDFSVRWMDDVVLPDEPVETNDLDAEQFMRVLGLCTHEYRQTLEARRSERKRRNVTSTEKTDYHYGKLDPFEQQYRNAATAAKKKRALLLSPPRTRTRGRKPNAATVAAKEAAKEEARVAAELEAARDMAENPFLSASTSGATTAHAVREPSVEDGDDMLLMQAPRKTYANRGAAKRRSAEMAAAAAAATAAAVAAAAAATAAAETATSIKQEVDDDSGKCMSCNKTTIERTRQCSGPACDAFYHLSCHTSANIPSQSLLQMSATAAAAATLALTEHDNFCPDCVRRRRQMQQQMQAATAGPLATKRRK